MRYWVCVKLNRQRLWTAELYDGNTLVKSMDGGYPKANQVIWDVKRTWGVNLPVKILPEGFIPHVKSE